MQIPCDKCVNGIDEDDDEGTCGVCSGTAEVECHLCGGSGRVQEFKTKEVTAFETQQNADGGEEGTLTELKIKNDFKNQFQKSK